MTDRLLLALVLGAVWGGIWAAILQWTQWGQWMALKRTWITVVIGVGIDGLICLLVLPVDLWWRAALVVAASSVAIIARSLYNELNEDR